MTTSNPLSQWYRQPKLFVQLPSKGRFYPDGALDSSVDNTYPVYAMTAKDELLFKTPDALLSGQSTVELFKSCIPAIVDPWNMPSIDVDFLLVAIRIATYGEGMDVDCTCPKCSNVDRYEINLTNYTSAFSNFNYESDIKVNDLVIKVRPYTYRETTKKSIEALEQQKIYATVSDDKLSDEEKINAVGESFVKIVNLTVNAVAECIYEIETPTGSTSDLVHIKEFISNTDKETFNKVSNHLISIKNQIEFKNQSAQCTACQHIYDVPIILDQSDFFGVRS